MALSEAQRIKIAEILGQTPNIVYIHLQSGAVTVSAAVQSAIEAQIALWDAGAGTETVKLHPTESNKGVETSPGSDRALIRKTIAGLLERPDWVSSGGAKLQRG